MELTKSDYIYKLKAYAESLGVKVIFFAEDLPDNIAGRVSYKEKWIKIGSICDSEEALLTLAHEVGHWLSYLRYNKKFDKFQNDFTVEQRENFAYLFGWYALKQINATSIITKEQWKSFTIAETL